MNETFYFGMLICLFVMIVINFYNVVKHLKEHKLNTNNSKEVKE